MESTFISHLLKVLALQASIQDLHPFLAKAFPIALVEEDQFWIYDLAPSSREYILVTQAPTPMPIPVGVRAAFQLEAYAGRMACVVTPDVFDDPYGYVTIFHEFIHCQQADTCEQQLKERLSVARQAQAANDPMWEINYPFPYASDAFAQAYASCLSAQELKEIEPIRQQLQGMLSDEDYEYMVWQEWKEGFARYIENRIRQRLSLPENHGGSQRPFSRVTFYAGGAHYIQGIGRRRPELLTHIEALFDCMLKGEIT